MRFYQVCLKIKIKTKHVSFVTCRDVIRGSRLVGNSRVRAAGIRFKLEWRSRGRRRLGSAGAAARVASSSARGRG